MASTERAMLRTAIMSTSTTIPLDSTPTGGIPRIGSCLYVMPLTEIHVMITVTIRSDAKDIPITHLREVIPLHVDTTITDEEMSL